MQMKKKYKKGLALSGGGARGVAHLGAARALYEEGHSFDVIIGTSMGAIVGCLLADSLQPEEIMKILTPKILKTFIRPEISKNGMMTMRGAHLILDGLLKTKNIEDLPIPFIATVTNLTSGKSEYIKSGNIIDAVLASASIPVVFPPMEINGKQYIDGGVLNNLPVRYIRPSCEKIAGFHVNPRTLGLHNGNVKGIAEIAERSFHLCMLGNVIPDIAMCDFYLEHANLNEFSMLGFERAHEIYKRGYSNTKQALKKQPF